MNRLAPLLPYAGAVAALGDDSKTLAILAGAAVKVGTEIEVQTGSLPVGAQKKLGRWCEKASREFPVTVVTELYRDHQTYTSGSKKDLHEAYQTLVGWADIGQSVETILGSDAEQARVEAEQFGWDVDMSVPGLMTLTYTAPGGGWPDLFGGAKKPCEKHRQLTLGVRHAKWRDRKVRRLVDVKVESVSIWPGVKPRKISQTP